MDWLKRPSKGDMDVTSHPAVWMLACIVASMAASLPYLVLSNHRAALGTACLAVMQQPAVAPAVQQMRDTAGLGCIFDLATEMQYPHPVIVPPFS